MTQPAAEQSIDQETPRVSVVLCTYNRAALLPAALRSLAAQVTDVPFEIIVVDNNSSDSTREVVHRFVADGPSNVRYLFEGKQGLSHARNAGIGAARGSIIAFTDDDIAAAPDWIETMSAAFADSAVACIGGKVLPQWPAPPPAWLTKIHWSPLALVDRGDHPIVADANRPLVFVGANLVVRKSMFDVVGYFAADLQRVKDGIGSTEDHEFLLRIYHAGYRGLYVPTLVTHAPVQEDRLDKRYHRRWHTGHGRFMARMDLVKPDPVSPNLFGIPSYYYAGLLHEVVDWTKALRRKDEAIAFHHEVELRSAASFIAASRRQSCADGATTVGQVARFFTLLVRKKLAGKRVGQS